MYKIVHLMCGDSNDFTWLVSNRWILQATNIELCISKLFSWLCDWWNDSSVCDWTVWTEIW